jgi:hypothetical protein
MRRVRDSLYDFFAAIRMTKDFRMREELVAVHVIAVMVRVHETAEILAGGPHRCGDESSGRHGTLRSVDGKQVVLTSDHPGIGNAGRRYIGAAGLSIRVDVRSEFPQLAVPTWRHWISRIRCRKGRCLHGNLRSKSGKLGFSHQHRGGPKDGPRTDLERFSTAQSDLIVICRLIHKLPPLSFLKVYNCSMRSRYQPIPARF